MNRILYYGIVLPLSKMPMFFLYGISNLLYLVLYKLIGYRKKVVEAQLRRCFPEKSDKEILEIQQRFYRHLADIFVEGVKGLSISRKELKRRMIVKNPELIQQIYDNGKSVVMTGGHINNWEWLAASNMYSQHKAIAIGMPLSNKFWNEKINQHRERYGVTVAYSKNYKEEIAARENQLIALLNLGDQSPGNAHTAYWTTFFNQTTPFLFGTEMMALTYDLSVVYGVVQKVKRGYYTLEFFEIQYDKHNYNYGDITEKYVQLLEKQLRNDPAGWLWSHKRWKLSVPENLEELKLTQMGNFKKKFGEN